MRKDIVIRPEKKSDYHDIISLILRSFSEGTDYSDGTDVVAFAQEIRESKYYIPKLSFVAELNGVIVGHFMFSHFPLSATKTGNHDESGKSDIVMLGPVAVHADCFRSEIGTAMLTMGIEYVKQNYDYKGITVEGNYKFYNRFGFKTSSEFGIYPTSGRPLEEPRCMMCMETKPGSMKGTGGFVVYDMYYNA